MNKSTTSQYNDQLVILSFKDENEYELKEASTPVSGLTLVRTALAVLNKYDLTIWQMNVKIVFLNVTFRK